MNEDELLTQSREKETARRYAVQDAKQHYREMGVPECHNRIVTPYSDPQKFTRKEKALFDAGKCGWMISYGTVSGNVYCGGPSSPGASFGHCKVHDAELLEQHYPDGSRKE